MLKSLLHRWEKLQDGWWDDGLRHARYQRVLDFQFAHQWHPLELPLRRLQLMWRLQFPWGQLKFPL